MRTDTFCYGYGRHSTAKQEFTRAAQLAKVKAYWRQHLKPKGVRWGGSSTPWPSPEIMSWSAGSTVRSGQSTTG